MCIRDSCETIVYDIAPIQQSNKGGMCEATFAQIKNTKHISIIEIVLKSCSLKDLVCTARGDSHLQNEQNIRVDIIMRSRT
eukprot:2393593-Amphidinium_carterae.1